MQPVSINERDPKVFYSKPLKARFEHPFPKAWHPQGDNHTYFFNTLGILAPSFERLFILSVLKFRKRLKNTPLEQPARAFLAQEAQHEHHIKQFIDTLETQHGYPVDALDKSNLSFCKTLNRRCSSEMQLAFTMGAEHIIALLSHHNLENPTWLNNLPSSIAQLWRWHAIEEIEHKAVAYDVYHAVCGSYWKKVIGMLVVTGVLMGMWTRVWWTMVKHDQKHKSLRFWKETCQFICIKPGLLRRIMIPWFKYFLPHFHPWQHNNQALLAKHKV